MEPIMQLIVKPSVRIRLSKRPPIINLRRVMVEFTELGRRLSAALFGFSPSHRQFETRLEMRFKTKSDRRWDNRN